MSELNQKHGPPRKHRSLIWPLLTLWSMAGLACWGWSHFNLPNSGLQKGSLAAGLGLLWAIGAGIIIFVHRRIPSTQPLPSHPGFDGERWQFAMEGSGDGLWDWDVTTGKVFYSPQFKTMLGYEEHEIDGHVDEWKTRIHSDDLEDVVHHIQRHFAGEIPLFVSEHRLKCKDGTFKWVLCRGRIMDRTAKGKPQRMVGTHHDITLRKRSEEEHQILGRLAIRLAASSYVENIIQAVREETEALFHWDAHYLAVKAKEEDQYTVLSFVDTIDGQKKTFPGAVWPHNQGSSIAMRLQAREPILSNYPFDPKERRGFRFGNVNRPSACIMDAPVCSGEEVIGVLSVQSYTPYRYDSVELRMLQRVADIVAPALDRAFGRQALHESEAVLRALLDVATDSMILLDADHKIEVCNEVAAERLGRTRDAIIGCRLLDLYPPDAARVRETKLHQMVSSRQVMRFVAEHNGRLFDHHLLPLLDQTGKVYRSAFFAWDITELREAELRNAALSEQLRQSQKMQAIGQLAGGVAHNFNNLLLAISGNTEVIAGTLDKLPPETHGACMHALAQLRLAVEMGTNLTRRLLTFCRKQILHPVVFDPNEAILDIVEILRAVLGSSVELRLEAGKNIGCIHADPKQIEECILNLALNGRDAMPDGGTLTIRTSRTVFDENTAAQQSVKPGPYVCISVSDTGAGMDEHTRSRLFEPFFTTKPLGQGAGLGLATVYGFVKEAGGCIDVQSQPGQGTMFMLRLPEAGESVTPDRQIIQTAKSTNKSVLLCDDDEMIRELIVRYLGSKGYDVIATSDAESALVTSAEQKRPVDVLITDVQLKTINGLQLAQQLKQTNPHLGCVIISGQHDCMPSDQEETKSGMVFLSKPFQFSELLQAVQACAAHKKA